MAISVQSTPNPYATGHNNMFFVIDSDNKAQPDFKYILDVYISSTRVARMKVRPNPGFSDYGVFNINRVLQSYLLSNYFIPPDAINFNSITPWIEYVVKLGESYGGTDYEDLVTESSRFAYNAALSYFEQAKNSYSADWLNKWQTSRPDEFISIASGENFFLSAFPYPADPFEGFMARYFDGPNLGGSFISLDSFVTTDAFIANVGANLPAGTQSYEVILRKDGADFGTSYKFNVDACSPYESVPIHFLNRLGGIETHYFRLVSQTSQAITRKTMQELGYTFDGSNIAYFDTNMVFFETARPYAVTYRTKLKVTSEPLSDDGYKWLTQLLTSPQAYTEVKDDGNIYFMPVFLNTDTYEEKKRIKDRLTVLQLDFEFGQLNNTQLR